MLSGVEQARSNDAGGPPWEIALRGWWGRAAVCGRVERPALPNNRATSSGQHHGERLPAPRLDLLPELPRVPRAQMPGIKRAQGGPHAAGREKQ
jgi:hypothetical protein